MLTTYTTYAEVRAALGVSEEEISDETLELQMFETMLVEDFADLDALVLPVWEALPAEADRSAAQARFAALVHLYATYAVAYRLTDNVELFGFLKMSDGRASAERTKEAFANLRSNIAAMLARIATKLLAALLILEPETVLPVAGDLALVSSVGIAVDPVTG